MSSHNFFWKRTCENNHPRVHGIKSQNSSISALGDKDKFDVCEMTKANANTEVKQTLLLTGETAYTENKRKHDRHNEYKNPYYATFEGNHANSGMSFGSMNLVQRSSSVTKGIFEENCKNTNLSVMRKPSVALERTRILEYAVVPLDSVENQQECATLEKKSTNRVECKIPVFNENHRILQEKNLTSCFPNYEKSTYPVNGIRKMIKTEIGDKRVQYPMYKTKYKNDIHKEIPLPLVSSSKNKNSLLLPYQGMNEKGSVYTGYIKEDSSLVSRVNENNNGSSMSRRNEKSGVVSVNTPPSVYNLSKKEQEERNFHGENVRTEDPLIKKYSLPVKAYPPHMEIAHTQLKYSNRNQVTNVYESRSIFPMVANNNVMKEKECIVQENVVSLKERKLSLHKATVGAVTKAVPQTCMTSDLTTHWTMKQKKPNGSSMEEIVKKDSFPVYLRDYTLHGVSNVPTNQKYFEYTPLIKRVNEANTYKRNEQVPTEFSEYVANRNDWNIRKATLKYPVTKPLFSIPRTQYIQQWNEVPKKMVNPKYFISKEAVSMKLVQNGNHRIMPKGVSTNVLFSGKDLSRTYSKNKMDPLNEIDSEYMFHKNQFSVSNVKRSNTNIIPTRTLMKPLQVPSLKNMKTETTAVRVLSELSSKNDIIYFDPLTNQKVLIKEGSDTVSGINIKSHAPQEQMYKTAKEFATHDSMNVCANEKSNVSSQKEQDKNMQKILQENLSKYNQKFTTYPVNIQETNGPNEQQEVDTNHAKKESFREGSNERNRFNVSLPDLRKFYQIPNNDKQVSIVELHNESVSSVGTHETIIIPILSKNGKENFDLQAPVLKSSFLNPNATSSFLKEALKLDQLKNVHHEILNDSSWDTKKTEEIKEKEKLKIKNTLEEINEEKLERTDQGPKEENELMKNGSVELLNECKKELNENELKIHSVDVAKDTELVEIVSIRKKEMQNELKRKLVLVEKEKEQEEPCNDNTRDVRKDCMMQNSVEERYIVNENEGIEELQRREYPNDSMELKNKKFESCAESEERVQRNLGSMTFPWDKDNCVRIKRRSDLNTKEGIIMNTKLARYERVLIHTCINNLKWKRCNDNVNKGVFHWVGYNLNDFDHYNYTKKRKIINRIPSIYTYTKKKALTFLLSHLSFIYPHLFDFYPATFVLPENKHILSYVLNQNAGCSEVNKDYYIMKPDSGSMGIGVKLINKYSDIHISILNGYNSYIIQKYIDNPLLMYKKKFDFRIYVLLIPDKNYPKVFLSKIGFARLCTEEYKKKKKNIGNTYVHLTNYSINKDSENYIRKKNIHDKNNNKQLLSDVFIYLKNNGYDTESIWSQIKKISCLTSLAIYSYLKTKIKFNYKNSFNFYQLIGLDILLDDTGKAWLLEVNSNPSLRIDYIDPNYSFFEIQLESMFDRYVKEPVISEMFHIVYRKIYKKYFKNHSKKGLDTVVLSKYSTADSKGKKKKKRKEESTYEDTPTKTFSKKCSSKIGVCVPDGKGEHIDLSDKGASTYSIMDKSIEERKESIDSVDSSVDSSGSSREESYDELNKSLIEPSSHPLASSSMSNLKIKHMLKKRSKMVKQYMTKNDLIGSVGTFAEDGEGEHRNPSRSQTVSFKKDSNETFLSDLSKELVKTNGQKYEESNFVLHNTEIKKEHNSIYLQNSNEIYSNEVHSNQKIHCKIGCCTSRRIPIESSKGKDENMSDSDCSCDSYQRRMNLMNAYSSNQSQEGSDFHEMNHVKSKQEDHHDLTHEERFHVHPLNTLNDSSMNGKYQNNGINEESDVSEHGVPQCPELVEESNFINKNTYIQVNDQTDVQLNQILREDLESYKNIYKNISDSVYRRKIENLMMIRTSLYKYMNCLNVLGIRYANNDLSNINDTNGCKAFNGEYKKVYTKIRKDILHPLKKNVLEKNIYVDLKKDMWKYYCEMKLYNKCLFLYEYVLKKYDVNLKRKKKKFEYVIDKNAFMSLCKDIQIHKLIESIEIVPTIVTSNNGKMNENIKNSQDIQMYQKIKEGLKHNIKGVKRREIRNSISQLHGSITEERTSTLSNEEKINKKESFNPSEPEEGECGKGKSSYSQISGFCPFSFNSTTNHLMNLNTRSMNNLKIKKKKKKVNMYDIEFLFVRQVFFNKYINKNLGLTVIDFFLLMQQLSLLVFPFISYLSLYNVLYPYETEIFVEMNRQQECATTTTTTNDIIDLEKNETTFCKQNIRPSTYGSLGNSIRKSFKGKRKMEKEKRMEKEESNENRMKRESRNHFGNTTRVLKRGKDKRSTSMKLQNGIENKLEMNNSIINKPHEKKHDPNLWHKHICNNMYNLYEYTQIHVSTEVKNICLETFLTFVFTKFGITYTTQ